MVRLKFGTEGYLRLLEHIKENINLGFRMFIGKRVRLESWYRPGTQIYSLVYTLLTVRELSLQCGR